MPETLPFQIDHELEGWELFWAHLAIERDAPEELAALRDEVAAAARQRFASTADLSSDPTVAGLRRLFRAAGCAPTKYRPASEALLRRLVKGDSLPVIQPLVDLNNCLSATLAVPCCVMVDGSFGTSLRLRSGTAGEAYESLRGPFNLEGKPLLVDDEGPIDTPITGNQRVKVVEDTRRAWLVAYLPGDVLSSAEAWKTLERFAARVGIQAEWYSAA